MLDCSLQGELGIDMLGPGVLDEELDKDRLAGTECLSMRAIGLAWKIEQRS